MPASPIVSADHQLRWAATPKALVKVTPWGWRSCCTCGWVQPGELLGKQHEARKAWRAHAWQGKLQPGSVSA